MANLAANIKIGASLDRTVGKSFRQIEQRSHRLGSTVGRTTQAQTTQAGRAIQSGLQGQIIGTVAPALALGAPIAKAIEFESTLAEIGKVVNFDSANGLEKMGQSILNMATDGRIPLAASEIGDIVAAAGQAGIARHELLRFTEDAAKIGVAFDLSGKQAGSAMTGLRTIFGLNQDEAVLVADSFNHLSNNMDATARGILNVTNRVGGMGKMIGLSGQQVGALAATFISLKTPPEIAATGMKALFQNLATAPEGNKKFQEGLAELGFTAQGMKTSIERDAQGTIIHFLKTVKGSKDQIGVLSKLFGREYADDISKLVGSLGTYEKSLGLIGDKTQFAGSAQKEYEVRAKTTENSLQLLRNQTNRVAINLGNTLLPAVNVVINAMSKGIAIINTVIVKNEGLAKVVFTVVGAFIAYQTGIMAARFATMAFGQSMIGFGALVSPIGVIIAALAVGGILIQRHWGKIAAFFEGFSAGFKATVGPAFKPIIAALLRVGTAFGQFFQPIVQSKEALDEARSAGERFGIMLGRLANRLATIPQVIGQIGTRIAATPFFRSGVAVVTTIGAGIRAGAARLVAIFSGVLARVRDYLPFSDAKIGPLSRLTASGRAIITTIAAGIKSVGARLIAPFLPIFARVSRFIQSVGNRLLAPLRPIFTRFADFLGPAMTARLKSALRFGPLVTPIRLALTRLMPVFARMTPVVKTLALGGFRVLAFVVRPLTALFTVLGGGLSVVGGGLGVVGSAVGLLTSLFSVFGLKLALFAGAVFLIVKFRRELGAFFVGFKQGFMTAIAPALERVMPVIRGLTVQFKPLIDRFRSFFGIFSGDESQRLASFAEAGRRVGAVFGIVTGALVDVVTWLSKSSRQISEFFKAAGIEIYREIGIAISFVAASFKTLWGVAKGVYETMFSGTSAFQDATSAGRVFGRALVIAVPLIFGMGFIVKWVFPLVRLLGTSLVFAGQAALGAVPFFKGVFTRITAIGKGALTAAGHLNTFAISGIGHIGTASTFLRTLSFASVIAGIKGIGLALLANPVGLTIAGIALAAVLIFKFWSPIKRFFAGVWEGVMSVFTDGNGKINETFASIGQALQPIIDGFRWLWSAVRTAVRWFGNLLQPVKSSEESLVAVQSVGVQIGEVIGFMINLALTPLINTFKALVAVVNVGITVFDAIKTSMTEALDWLSHLSLFNVGEKIMGTLSGGLKAAGGLVKSSIKGVFSGARKLFPQSDAQEGPFSQLTSSGRALITTFARGIGSTSPNTIGRPLQNRFAAAMTGLALAAPITALAGDLPTARSPLDALQSSPVHAGPQTAGGDIHITVEIGGIQITAQTGQQAHEVLAVVESNIEDIMRRVAQRAAVQSRGGLHDGDHVGIG